MGSVVEMRSIQAALLAIVAALALIGAITSIADASTGVVVAEATVTPPPEAAPSHDPGDPGLPPD
jgi:hypothetical protein